ncbi:phage baseplate assembly protein V [Nakamurella antarctica]|nr:phage baseplate assembly protein V [Nakamurella antarctica]
MPAATNVGATTPEIRINGRELDELSLGMLSVIKIESCLRMSARALIRFSDPGYLISTPGTFAINNSVVVSTLGVVLFSGSVTGVELEHHQGSVDFIVTADDKASALALGSKVRTFTNVTISDVVKTMLAGYGMKTKIEPTGVVYPYLIQSGSDLDFINELCDRVGFDWWVEDGTFVFAAPINLHTPVKVDNSDELFQFTVKTTALHPGQTTVTGWWSGKKQAVTGQADLAKATLKPDANFVKPFVEPAHLSALNKLTHAGSVPLDAVEAGGLARAMAQRWVSQAVTAKGVCFGKSAIKAGCVLAIANAGPASGSYYVTQVEHTYSRKGFQTKFTAGDRRSTSIVDTLNGPGRGAARGAMVVGVVTALANGTDEQPAGNVKVKYPSIGDGVESNWARVVSIGGGNGRGFTFLPEVNDEVMVAFESGDMRRPIVLGGLFNTTDQPGDFGVNDGAVDRRRITSRLGHSLEFSDDADTKAQHIALALAGGKHTVKLGKEALLAEVPAGVPITVKSGDTVVEISKAGDITLSGSTITLKASKDIELSGANVTIKANVKLAASAAIVEVKASAKADLSAGGIVAVKGAMVQIN